MNSYQLYLSQEEGPGFVYFASVHFGNEIKLQAYGCKYSDINILCDESHRVDRCRQSSCLVVIKACSRSRYSDTRNVQSYST